MKAMYEITIAISSERSPAASLILPLHAKLLQMFEVKEADTCYKKNIRQAVYNDLNNRYQNPCSLMGLRRPRPVYHQIHGKD